MTRLDCRSCPRRDDSICQRCDIVSLIVKFDLQKYRYGGAAKFAPKMRHERDFRKAKPGLSPPIAFHFGHLMLTRWYLTGPIC